MKDQRKKDRKNLPKAALPRLYFIDREIASGKYPSTRTLAQGYEVSIPTISRDIEFMKDMLNAPIEYNPKRKGYYYTEQTFRLPAAYSTAEDMLALGMAKTLLSLYRDTPVYAAASQLMESITAPFTDPQNPRWYEDRIVVPPVPSVTFSPDIWRVICEALRDNRVLAFEYRSTWKSPWLPRRVLPYQLLFDNGAWYLYAWAEERRAVRMFSLPRIRNIRTEAETFTLPAACRAHTQDSYFGAWSGGKKRRYRIAFYNDGAMRVQERRWAADQRIEETPDGIILSFTSAQYGKILELVLSNGRDALPLEPEELVKDWQDNLRDMRKHAKILQKQ